MQITRFAAVEREMSYVHLSSTEAAIRIKARKGSPALVKALDSHCTPMPAGTK